MPNQARTAQDDAQIEEASYYFGLLSEPTRLKILSTLCHGEKPVNTIVDAIEATQANVSRQLNMLYQAKILGRRKHGTQVYYRISDPRTIELCRSMCRKMAIAIRSRADGCHYETCRMPDNRCGIDGAECQWQPLQIVKDAAH